MKPIQMIEDRWWVGAVDYDNRNFHGYMLAPKGTTYNAFLLKGDKTVLFDTVKDTFSGSFLCNVAHLTDKVDYFVVNHLEPDHAGALPEAVARFKPEKIFVSPAASKTIAEIYPADGWPIEVVKTGQTVNLGKYDLSFLETRMLHWPDNMMTYIPQLKVLLSSDAFGQNLATSERYCDQVDKAEVFRQMTRYFANIVSPYADQAAKAMADVAKLGWEVGEILPDHGMCFRGGDIGCVMSAYSTYCCRMPKAKAVVVYDTMWHSTEKMAHTIAGGLLDEGLSVRVMSVKANHHSDIMEEVFDAAAVVAGSATHNNTMLPYMASTLNYMKGLRPKNKIAAAFGSFGWSGEAAKIISEHFTAMGLAQPVEALRVKNVPRHEGLAKCFEFGRQIAQAAKATYGL